MYGRNSVGPQVKPCDDLHAMKYRLANESFEEAISRQAGAMSDDEEHRKAYKEITMDMRFLPAGRVQSAMGSPCRSSLLE